MTQPNVIIYALVDPRSPSEIRYVGKTDDLQRRVDHHVYYSFTSSTRSGNWTQSLVVNELRPTPIILQKNPPDGWISAERYWIKFCRDLGFDLTNHTDGGEGAEGYRHTLETKMLLGRPKSLETRAKMSQAQIGNEKGQGHKHSAETKYMLSQKLTGLKRSPESCAKIGASKKGHKYWVGKHHSEATKEKLRSAATGRVLSPETKAKISEGLKRLHSEK